MSGYRRGIEAWRCTWSKEYITHITRKATFNYDTRTQVQLPLPSQAAEQALSSYLLCENEDDDDDSSSVTSFRSYVSSTNSYATMTTATREEEAEEIYESRLQAFNSVSTIDTRSLFGHSVIPDDESLFSSRRSMSSSGSSSVYDDDDDDDDLHAPPGMKERKEKKKTLQQKDAIVKVQRWFRKNIKSPERRKRRDSIVHIQRHFRGWRVRRSKKKTKTPWRP